MRPARVSVRRWLQEHAINGARIRSMVPFDAASSALFGIMMPNRAVGERAEMLPRPMYIEAASAADGRSIQPSSKSSASPGVKAMRRHRRRHRFARGDICARWSWASRAKRAAIRALHRVIIRPFLGVRRRDGRATRRIGISLRWWQAKYGDLAGTATLN